MMSRVLSLLNSVLATSVYSLSSNHFNELKTIIINIRGQIENRPLQNTRSAGRKRLTAGG